MSEPEQPKRSDFHKAVKAVLVVAGFVALVIGGMQARQAQRRNRAAENLRQLKTAIDTYSHRPATAK
jgi:hypothetical protein